MAGPIAGYVQLPTDAGNTGKKIQTQSEVVGADTVFSHLYVPRRAAKVLGVYGSPSAVFSVQAAAHNGSTTGFLWLTMPVAATGKAFRIRRCVAKHVVSAATPTIPTLPRILMSRITLTGAASGASQAMEHICENGYSPVMDFRTASTGLTVTLLGGIAQTIVPPFFLAGTAADIQATNTTLDPLISIGTDEDEWPMAGAGGGFVIWQADAGTASDTRRFTIDIVCDEIDVA
jgi:hypothetical protein